MISLAQLERALRKMGFDLAQEDVEQIFISFDGNHDGRIDYRDFCDAIIYEVDPLAREHRGKESKRARGKGGAINSRIPWKRLAGQGYPTGIYYDWAASSGARPLGETRLAAAGTLGAWVETQASAMERRNFFELLNMLSMFEEKLGTRPANAGVEGKNKIQLQLGPKLSVKLDFEVSSA